MDKSYNDNTKNNNTSSVQDDLKKAFEALENYKNSAKKGKKPNFLELLEANSKK